MDEEQNKEGGTFIPPEPPEDHCEYVANVIKWREESYDPEQVIGGPRSV